MKFFQEDIVQHLNEPACYGVVMRCWQDNQDDLPPHASLHFTDPSLRPLKRGEIGVSFYPNNRRDILPESEFKLIDRPLQTGDICKRSYDDIHSAVVTNVETRFKVSHAVTSAVLDEWKTMDDVKNFDDIGVSDFVEYNGWIGQVQDFFDVSTIEISDGTLVRLPEVSAHLTIGERGSDILPSRTDDHLTTVLSYFMGDLRPSKNDLVVGVNHTVYAIAWLAINQMKEPDEISSSQRPKRFWYGEAISELTLLRGYNELLPRVGDRLTLKDVPVDTITTHGKEDVRAGTMKVETFVVCETETYVDLLWQDGSREKVRSTSLVPYLNPDEYDCWPGDHVVWKNEDGKKGAIVQSVNAKDRTADLLLYDNQRVLVSTLELDSHGADLGAINPQDVFGVRRSELVFLHREGTTNGCEKPVVPSIGELEPWVYEAAATSSGELFGWRKELGAIGRRLYKESPELSTRMIKRPVPGSNQIDWFGLVTDLRLDGLVEVTLMDFTKVYVPLDRITRLTDVYGELDEEWAEGILDGHFEGHDLKDVRPMQVQTEDGQWHEYKSEDEDEWIEEDEDMVEESIIIEDTLMDMDGDEAQGPVPGAWPSNERMEEDTIPEPDRAVPSANGLESAPSVSGASVRHDVDYTESAEQSAAPWKRFEILPSAPLDHAFYGTTSSQPSRQFLSRLSKEYRALQSGLPETIIVRTYEDRTDLLRCLIIGPENTPYEDAPFVIDWMLDGNFPQSPPIAHFHSWTNGNGRVNPNLYEEGKVCLSILGTWAGDHSESWSAARSSLLQAFVSIQGLVLVKEPWFCEPAYEKWRGTNEGKVNSRLYNEKAYVLSKGFVRRALETPIGDLHDVVNTIYFGQGRLAKVVNDTRDLIKRSRTTDESEDDADRAIPRLTEGGIIPLLRTLDKLEAILESKNS